MGRQGGRVMTRTHFCEHCGDPLRWVISKAGRIFPIDPSSDPRGNFMLTEATLRNYQVAVGLDKKEQTVERERGTLLFLHHQAVCKPRGRRGSPPPPAVKKRYGEIISRAKSGGGRA